MPKINLTVDHKLGQEEAKKRLAGLITQSRAQFASHVSDVAETWNGYTDVFSFRAMGFSVSGEIQVEPAQVHIAVELPFAAMLFKSRVESEMLTRARQLLA